MEAVAGINVEHKKIVIQPYPDRRLGYVNACYDSPLGMIVSNWAYNESGITYHIEIPAGEKAIIRLQGMKEFETESGIFEYSVSAQTAKG